MTAAVPPAPVPARVVETKVLVATAITGLAGLGGAMLNAFVGSSALLGSLPAWAQFLVVVLAPPLATFLAGYAAPHTPR